MEKVNHPAHYNIPGKKECIEEMLEKYGVIVTGIFCLTNCYKYLYRAGIKEGESQNDDVQKAQWYFNWVKNHSKELNTNSMHAELFNCTKVLYDDVREALKKYGKE